MSDMTPFSANSAEATREQAAKSRADLARSVEALREKQAAAKAEMQRKRAEMEAELQRQTQALAEQMAPLEKQLAQMKEVLWSVNLYLGRDETLQLLRDGDPAPADTPITIRQKVLVMAEESLFLELDHSDIDTFTDWLQESPANLDRVLPEPKGVVVLVPTRVKSESGNIWEDGARDQANEASHWLLRNGDRLYLLTVDEALRVGERILPRRAEFTDVFERGLFGFGRKSGEPLEPGSEEWMELEERASAKRRHYMRLMMVLQGIVDRTVAWRPLPGAGVNLLTTEAQDSGKVVLIQDDEDSITLGDGHETFAAYRKRLNGLLRPGLRVIGDWKRHNFDPDSSEERQSPRFAEGVQPNVPYLLEDRRHGGFVFRFKRTDPVYRTGLPVPSKPGYIYTSATPTEATKRASYLVRPDDWWVLPYDLVTVPDLEYFLASRQERSKEFLTMVPTIRAALKAKRAEAEAEADFRVLLRGMLSEAGAEADTVDSTLDELVHWWKVKNTWSKPLNGDPAHEAKAAREIVKEFTVRQEAAAAPEVAERMVKAGRKVPGAICVAQNRQGKWFAYAPSKPAFHKERVWLDVTPIRKNGTLGDTKTWQKVQQRSAALLNVAWSSDDWATWNFTANPHHYLTGPERETIIRQIRDRAESTILAIVEFHDPANPKTREFGCYTWVDDAPVTATASLPITATRYLATKDAHGPHLTEHNRYISKITTKFGWFSGGSKWGNTPWWPDDARDYRDARPRLGWSDEDALNTMLAWRKQQEALRDDAASASEKLNARASRYADAINDIIMDTLTAQARARFEDDFGKDAEDLWPGHVASLNLRCPISSSSLHGLIRALLREGHTVAGKTLGSLNTIAQENKVEDDSWSFPIQLRPVPMGDFEDLVVPDVEA